MRVLKNVLLSVFNNIEDANNRKVMLVRNNVDAEKLIESAQQSKLNPLAGGSCIPFSLSTPGVDLVINEEQIIGVLTNTKVLSTEASGMGIMYVVSDMLIDDAYYFLMKQNLHTNEHGFLYLNSESVGFGLRGITSGIDTNIDEVLQIITFDLIINYNPEVATKTPVIDEDSAVCVDVQPSAEPVKEAKKTTRNTEAKTVKEKAATKAEPKTRKNQQSSEK